MIGDKSAIKHKKVHNQKGCKIAKKKGCKIAQLAGMKSAIKPKKE